MMPTKRSPRAKSAPPPPAPPPPRPSRRALPLLFLIILAGIALAWPKPRAWQILGPGLGRIRWVETRTDPLVRPPLAPQWVRDLRARGIPWPTDLLLEPSGASFGGGTGAAAWYLVQSSQPADEFWHLDKASIKVTDRQGREVPWTGGSGAAAVDHDRGLHYLYLGVPADLAGTGGRLRFRLKRFRGPTSEEVSLPF
jgi:hypothetical protein